MHTHLRPAEYLPQYKSSSPWWSIALVNSTVGQLTQPVLGGRPRLPGGIGTRAPLWALGLDPRQCWENLAPAVRKGEVVRLLGAVFTRSVRLSSHHFSPSHAITLSIVTLCVIGLLKDALVFPLSTMVVRPPYYFGFGFPLPSDHRTVSPPASLLCEYLCAGYCIRSSYTRLGLCDQSISVSLSARDGFTGHRFRSYEGY